MEKIKRWIELLPRHKLTSFSSLKTIFIDLPQDIVADIFSRLPVKSLICLRCVCKPWLNLTLNPKFIKAHLQKSSLSVEKHRIIVSHSDRRSSIARLPLLASYSLSFRNHHVNNAIYLDYPRTDRNDHINDIYPDYSRMDENYLVRVVGSCNGLVCIFVCKEGIFLWNPCIKKSKILPRLEERRYPFARIAMFGFGYDQSNDDYKVVFIRIGIEMNVYSLRTNSWRRLREFPANKPLDGQGKYVNGALHWMIGSKIPMVIVSLDLGKETFDRISQPDYGDIILTYLSLGVLQDCLSIFCQFHDSTQKISVDVWVMREYGKADSWTKLYTIPYSHGPQNIPYSPFFCFNMTGEIVLKYRWSLGIYNPTNGTLRFPKIGNFSTDLSIHDTLTYYVESFVSPNTDNDDDEVPKL